MTSTPTIHQDKDIHFLIIDLFCGAGGTTTGFEDADFESLRSQLATLGVDMVGHKVAKVIACVNHDHLAIKSHWANHPDVEHFEEDIRLLNPYGRLKELVDHYRKLYPNAKIILWGSLECTNFSKAKGGLPRDADSRTLANHLDKYILALDPDYIQIENVVEFMAWGPMRIKARKKHKTHTELCIITNKETKAEEYGYEPISKRNGEDWMRWRKRLCSYGYTDSWKELNAADFGAYTSRNRLFGCFAKPGLPIIWPEPTHAQEVKVSASPTLFTEYNKKKWKPVKEVLNFSEEGKSIFNRRKYLKNIGHAQKMLRKSKKCKRVTIVPAVNSQNIAAIELTLEHVDQLPQILANYQEQHGKTLMYYDDPLSEKSLSRLYAGLIKFVAGGKKNFLIKYNSTSKTGKYVPPSTDQPCPTLSTQDRIGVVNTSFISKYYSGNTDDKNISVDRPVGTITCIDHHALVNASFLTKYYSGNDEFRNVSIEEPAGALRCANSHALVSAEFLVNYKLSSDANSLEGPAPTLTTRDSLAMVKPCFLLKYFGTGENISSVEDPACTLTTKDRMAKVSASWIDKTYTGPNNHQSIDQPAGVIMANDKHRLVQANWIDRNFTGGGQHSSIEDPAGTVMPVPKMNLVKAEPFILPGNYTNPANSVEEPAPTILASRRHHYIVNPSHQGHTTGIEVPCPVIIARQDKSPLYLIEVICGDAFIPVYDDDPKTMVDIKEFMALYGLADIKMRMLMISELLPIQGFPGDYKLHGNQSDKKKFIGNAVHPLVPKKWIEAMVMALISDSVTKLKKKTA